MCYGMSHLSNICIPNSVTSIGDYAFSDCSSLDSVIIPNSVTSIGNYAFMDCSSLDSVIIPNSVTSIGAYAFAYCSALSSVTIPNSVTSISGGAFAGCSALTTVTIPNSVTSISNEVFHGCGLKSIVIPNSITSIGWAAFSYCTALTYVSIGSNVTSIDMQVFEGCTNLASIRVNAQVPPKFVFGGYGSFKYVPNEIPVYIPCGTKDAYQNSYGSYFTNIIEWHEYNAIINSFANGVVDTISYTCDDELTIQATANEHYHFTQWSDGNTENPRTFTVFQDTTLTAAFSIDQHIISVIAENGHVEGAGTYDYGMTDTLTAIADEHYHFVQWSDGNTDNPRTIMIKGDATYTAEFAIDRHTITTTCDIRYGEVTGDGVYDYGTRITLTAIPNSGYEFKQWSNGLTYNPYRFTVVSDLNLEAEFVPATAINDIQADTDTVTTPQKILIDGQVYILRNGKTYTLTGVEVESL